jgi:GTPase
MENEVPVGHRSGWAAIVGAPNAGKSTLLNALVGSKVAIVSPRAQTTRNRIGGILTNDDAQIVFLDTPGVRRERGKMHRVMQQSAWQSLTGADVIVVVVDAEMGIRKPEYLRNDLKEVMPPVRAAGRPVLVAANKVDLFRDKQRMLPMLEEMASLWPEAEIFPVSALRRDGLDPLFNAVQSYLPQAPPMFPEDQIATVSLRFMAAESIREKLFQTLYQELPYSIAVDIELWDESEDSDVVEISAVIYVGRSSHKGMVIGRGGQLLKKTGIAARKDIEALLERRVYLNLRVKVREGWTEDETFLRSLGLMS